MHPFLKDFIYREDNILSAKDVSLCIMLVNLSGITIHMCRLPRCTARIQFGIHYSKYSKISNTLFHNFFANILFCICLFHKILDRMANSIDPDRTVRLLLQEYSDLSLNCLHLLFC